MSTELASGVAPLANGENDGRRGTVPRQRLLKAKERAGQLQLASRLRMPQSYEFL
jgi:hypothetical protein